MKFLNLYINSWRLNDVKNMYFNSWIQGQLDLQNWRRRVNREIGRKWRKNLLELELGIVYLIHAHPSHTPLIPHNVLLSNGLIAKPAVNILTN